MDLKYCKRGFYQPRFHHISDIDDIRKTYDQDGAVFFDGCDEENLVILAKQLGRVAKPRNEVAAGTGVSNIRYVPGLIGKGYSSEELFFHTDRSGWDIPPGLLLTTLKIKSETGGESLLVDGHSVIESIKAHDISLYELIINPKYSSFRADDGSFQPRPIYDEKASIFRFRFDDGVQLSASLIDRYSELRQILYDHAYAVSLQPGQSYVLDNHRFLHGRTSFTGARELLRVLAYPHATVTIKPILFDVDGTLCRSEALSIDAYYCCVSDVVGQKITNENTKVNLHGQTDSSLLQDILRYHAFEESEIKSAVKKFFQLHPKYLETSLAKGFDSRPCPGAQDFLDWLAVKKQDHSLTKPKAPIGLLTGNSQPNAILKIKAAGIDPSVFDLSISSFGDEHDTRLGLFEDSMRKLKSQYGDLVSAGNVTLVGDTPLDVECAKRAGCNVVAVSTGNYSKDQLARLGPATVCERLPEAEGYFAAVICC